MILNPDPTKRFTIQDIRAHPWYNQVEHPAPYTPAIFLGKEPIPIDQKILGMLERDHGIEPAKAEIEIQKNKFTNTTTSYYLLLKRKERAGIFRQQYNEEVKKLLKKRKPAVNKDGEPTKSLENKPPVKGIPLAVIPDDETNKPSVRDGTGSPQNVVETANADSIRKRAVANTSQMTNPIGVTALPKEDGRNSPMGQKNASKNQTIDVN